MSFAWISEQASTISLYHINCMVFITESESVYCAVRTGSLNQTDTITSLKDYCTELIMFNALKIFKKLQLLAGLSKKNCANVTVSF